MAIQFRTGAYADFDATKMVRGEPAVVVSGDPDTESGKSVWVCTEPGSVERLVTEGEVEAQAEAEVATAMAGAIDSTLTQTGKAADAKATGDAISSAALKIAKVYQGTLALSAGETAVTFTLPSGFNKSYGVVLSQAWPMSTWENANVSICRDNTIVSGTGSVSLYSAVAQQYSVRLDLVYI